MPFMTRMVTELTAQMSDSKTDEIFRNVYAVLKKASHSSFVGPFK